MLFFHLVDIDWFEGCIFVLRHSVIISGCIISGFLDDDEDGNNIPCTPTLSMSNVLDILCTLQMQSHANLIASSNAMFRKHCSTSSLEIDCNIVSKSSLLSFLVLLLFTSPSLPLLSLLWPPPSRCCCWSRQGSNHSTWASGWTISRWAPASQWLHPSLACCIL